MSKYQREVAIKKIMSFKNTTYNSATEIIRKQELFDKYGHERGWMEENDEEDTGNSEFPCLRRTKRIDYWENLDFPIEKETEKIKRAWERNKQQRSYVRDEDRNDNDRTTENTIPEQNKHKHKWGHSSKILINSEEYKERNREHSREYKTKKKDEHKNNYKTNKGDTAGRVNRYPVQRGKEEAKRLHFIPRPHDLASEEEINPYNEGAPRIYRYPSTEK